METTIPEYLSSLSSGVKVAAASGGVTCLVICLVLISTFRWHVAISGDPLKGIQKFHDSLTPRVGGIGIYIGLLCAYFVSPKEVQALIQPMLLAVIPAFLSGLAEDLTKKVSVLLRLSACFFSGALAWLITGTGVDRIGIYFLDPLFGSTLVVTIFTAFAVSGICNAVNMIDGFNGLASGTVIMGLVAISLIAYFAGDTLVAELSFLSACVFAGFFFVNFPLGKIFLGDGGAYLLGFWLGWLSIILVSRNPSVSPFVALLVCAPALIETLFSIFRRILLGRAVGVADNEHLHSYVRTCLIARMLSKQSLLVRNSAVSVVLLPLVLAPLCVSILFWESTLNASLGFLGIILGYVILYIVLKRFSKK